MENADKVILALDTPDKSSALKLLEQLGGLVKKVKVGPGLFIQEGPALIETLQTNGYDVFLDLKHHDIPNTVTLAVKAAKKLGVWMLSIHLSGGEEMLAAAAREAKGSPLLVGISVLTSLSQKQLNEIGFTDSSIEESVKRLALLGEKARINGIVCSPLELKMLTTTLQSNTVLVTPGIRLPNEKVSSDDQSRTLTPTEAFKLGASYIVIGRPVTQSENPRETFSKLLSSLDKTSPLL